MNTCYLLFSSINLPNDAPPTVQDFVRSTEQEVRLYYNGFETTEGCVDGKAKQPSGWYKICFWNGEKRINPGEMICHANGEPSEKPKWWE